MDLSIIIVNYRCWSSLEICLNSLKELQNAGFSYEVLIVDNNSGDNIIEQFKEKYKIPFRFISNNVNGGFANGCNLGASDAKGNILLFLNPDTSAGIKAIMEMLSVIEISPEKTLVSCHQVNSNGREIKAYGYFPDLGTLTGTGRALMRLIKKEKIKPVLRENILTPDWISGSVIMIKKNFFSTLKGFDEDYWLYYEDIDLCFKARNEGGNIYYLPDITIIHNHGGSSRLDVKITAITKTEVLISRHIYVSKNFSPPKQFIAQTYLVVNNMISGFFICIPAILLFFIPKLYVRGLVFFRLIEYYIIAIRNKSWRSPRSVNFRRK